MEVKSKYYSLCDFPLEQQKKAKKLLAKQLRAWMGVVLDENVESLWKGMRAQEFCRDDQFSVSFNVMIGGDLILSHIGLAETKKRKS